MAQPVNPPNDNVNSDFVQSLTRGLAVIRAFDANHPALTLTEVARRAGISAAAARRFLHTLETIEYVRSDGRNFSLTPRVLELGYSFLSSLTTPQIMRPHLERLANSINESVSAAVLSGSDIVYIARASAHRVMKISISVGTRFPAYATSMGRVLLAQLPDTELFEAVESARPSAFTAQTLTTPADIAAEVARVRAQGWALINGELEEGLRSLAVPVRDITGNAVAAINVAANAAGLPLKNFRDHNLPLLHDTAFAIEAELRLLSQN